MTTHGTKEEKAEAERRKEMGIKEPEKPTTLLRIAVLGLSQNPRFTQFFLKNSKINCFMTLNVHGKLLGGKRNVLECMKNLFPSYFLILTSILIKNLLFKYIF